MPTYEYVCDACDHRLEELQSFSEPPLTKCPACKKKKLRRLFGTGIAVLFKGSGFYETDYKRGDSYQSAAKADAEGRFTPESVWLEWRDLCFGQKREPSPWLTCVVHRILGRGKGVRNLFRGGKGS